MLGGMSIPKSRAFLLASLINLIASVKFFFIEEVGSPRRPSFAPNARTMTSGLVLRAQRTLSGALAEVDPDTPELEILTLWPRELSLTSTKEG